MNTLKFLSKRIMLALIVLFGLSVMIFILGRVVPGDPARMALGANAPQETVDKMRHDMRLDEPLVVQYGYWFGGIFHGDFGQSLYTKRPVIDDLAEFFPATIELVIFSGLLMGLGGLILGILSTKFNNSWIDNIIRVISYLGVVTPSFVFAILFVLVFGYLWPIFPTMGRLSRFLSLPENHTGLLLVDSLIEGNWETFWDGFCHIILPAIALALGGLSQEARITRSSMLDNMSKDYILSHRAYGIPEKKVFFKYLLKPSLIPTVTVFGLDFATLFGNAFLVEMVFNWPGLSRYGMNVMLQKDLNAISAVILLLGAIFVFMNILTDLVVSFLDPRIQLAD